MGAIDSHVVRSRARSARQQTRRQSRSSRLVMAFRSTRKDRWDGSNPRGSSVAIRPVHWQRKRNMVFAESFNKAPLRPAIDPDSNIDHGCSIWLCWRARRSRPHAARPDGKVQRLIPAMAAVAALARRPYPINIQWPTLCRRPCRALHD